jgi:UDP-2-acetamido-2,6-beta-L-arabino-hexul-4-ose reductase
MSIVVTGAEGFIGRNLIVRLRESGRNDVVAIGRQDAGRIDAALKDVRFVFHLAGINRPKSDDEFETGNARTTEDLCQSLRARGRPVPVVFASSTQAHSDNPYGRSKRSAEEALLRYSKESGAPIYIFRLTNVFGKWARPNYNSAIATFCYNVARELDLVIRDPEAPLNLIYIDDVIDAFLHVMDGKASPGFVEAGPVFATTVGAAAEIVRSFPESRKTLLTPRVGDGLVRALYATYLSYLPTDAFAYDVPKYADARGVFVEMLKTVDSGQFSYFTAGPGVTRGDHYHHTKTEKFLVLTGTAHFGFRHLITGETREIVTAGGDSRIVETIPGWTHNITNIGEGEMVVMLWANEIFDRFRPDTVAMKV